MYPPVSYLYPYPLAPRQVICDRVSLELLKGAKIDYQEDMMRAAFVIGENPNATQSCGCGSSFATKS